jgi:uncharacterized protein YhfF
MWPRIDGLRALELGMPGPMRDQLNDLVLAGTKTATAGLWKIDYDAENEELETVSEQMALIDSSGQPVAVVVVERVESHRFIEVPWEFADAEGEGFTSIEHWREGHRSFFGRLGIEVSDDDRMICIWIRVQQRNTRRATSPDG